MANATTMNQAGEMSVRWQREILEHLGVQMDHGCRALGEVPMRFQDDEEVITSFQKFQQACGESMQKAMAQRKAAEEAAGKTEEKAVAVS